MAGDRELYAEALSEGASYAWERNWKESIAAYHRALDEFPNDVSALAGIGQAFLEAGRLEDALSAFRKASRHDRENPALPERVARILEEIGETERAAEAYLEAANRYNRREAPMLAIERWQDATRVDPTCVRARVRLLQTYLKNRQKKRAMEQYLSLAHVYESQGKEAQAMDLLQHALRLNPRNPEVLSMMDRIRFGEDLPPEPSGTAALDSSLIDDTRGSPVEMTRQKAQADLAEAVFGETPPQTGPLTIPTLSKAEVDALITRALDAQTRGDLEKAIGNYERVLDAGVIQPAVNFNLGLLFQQQLRFDEAIEQFQHSIDDPKYRLGSHFALGECHRARGRIDEALTHFIEVLKIVDMATVQRKQVDDLIQLYEELARAYTAKGERDQASEFVNSLIHFLGAKGWEDKVSQARERLNAVSQEGPILSLAEMLSVPEPDSILESLGLAQEYMRRGLEDAAMDELEHAILLAPTYLPTHRQMAELMLKTGKTEQAVSKFITIADLHQVRGNLSQATAVYERALSLAPMNVVVREKLIGLLTSHGKIDRALQQYLTMGDTFYQMAELDRAREKYNEALQLAPRGDPEKRWAVRILHRMGDIDMQRVDWRRAISVYEEIRKLAPDDEKARLTLIDLYYRFDRPTRAVVELDELIKALRQSDKSQKILPILEGIAQEHPEDIPIRTRLAQVYLDARDVKGALAQLDTLGELQIQTGRIEEACRTIRTILRLNPPNADAYRELLNQLASGQITA
ncbi:MAG: tetratricopeptide repeat protein [Anaerolineae bacterium]